MNKIECNNLYRVLSRQLSPKIDQHAIEKWAAAFWKLPRARKCDKTPEKSAKTPYVIMFPPPNVTGNLHLGHALTGAIQDALVRHRRMRGYDCLFVPGFDHAGLATQNIVEKILYNQQRISRQELGREKFIDLINQWKEQKRDQMRDQIDRLGLCLNRDREYFTMDENSSLAVQSAFKQLFNSGFIYRSVKPIYWSEQLQTTLSDIEVEQVDGASRYVRTGEFVERRNLSQWFIDTKAIAKRAVEVVEDDSISIIPNGYKRTWASWLLKDGADDWCISRQSWWGHRIPAYKLESSPDVTYSWIVADSFEEAQSKLDFGGRVEQDPDVLDTWFSSSLLPLTISGWPHQEKFAQSCNGDRFPLHIMETGFDILTFWVSKMVMMSLALTNMIPFKLVLLHGMICDSDGKKMSKSQGNVIDPLDVIDGASLDILQERTLESFSQGILDNNRLNPVLNDQRRLFPKGIPQCGADGLRAYLLSHDFQEEIVRVRIEQIEKVRRLSNKIWNIYRFALMILKTFKNNEIEVNNLLIEASKDLDNSLLAAEDRLVLGRLARCVHIAHETFESSYQLHYCFVNLELFWTVDLSQNYIESVKDTLLMQVGTREDQVLKLKILVTCLVNSTKLLHPFMPHLTEFVYQKLFTSLHEDVNLEDCRSLSEESYPNHIDWTIDQAISAVDISQNSHQPYNVIQ